MCRMRRALLLASMTLSLMVVPGPTQAQTQPQPQAGECRPSATAVERDLGAPTPEGTAVQDKLASVAAPNGYIFTVARPSAAFVYLGDQWFDLDLALYSRGQCIATWDITLKGYSYQDDRRVLQFVRPDEQIINLEPGEYKLSVAHKYYATPEAAQDFDPEKGYTVRVAIGPRVCKLEPPNDQPTLVPNLTKRRDDALYQLGLSIQPEQPGPFDLMTFTAVISPPYLDLFDFEWAIDGQVVPDNATATLQAAVIGLPKVQGLEHKVRLTAKGMREYMDPDPKYRHVPLNGGTLTVECTFALTGA